MFSLLGIYGVILLSVWMQEADISPDDGSTSA